MTNFSAVLEAGGRSYAARVINLSMGGALLDLGQVVPETPLVKGVSVSVGIRCRGAAAPLQVEARIVLWNDTSGDVPLLAVQFVDLDDERSELLEELMFNTLAALGDRGVPALG